MGANLAVSASIGCLFCCKGCNAEKVRNAVTFSPPRASYAIKPVSATPAHSSTEAEQNDDPKDQIKGQLVYLMEALNTLSLYRQAAECAEVWWVTTRRGCQIPIVWLRNESARKASASSKSTSAPPMVLLHCHGNATDIGMMMGPYFELAKVLGIEVVGVEYSGYGAAGGRPSAENTYADVEAAYDLLTRQGVPPKRIVAYGQSVGSGPVSSLAAKKQLGGVILHAPLLSGIKVVDPQPDKCCQPSCVWKCFDFYPNDRRIKSASCPVFVMHGQCDEIIPFYHGLRLHQACPKAYAWPGYFPARAGHNNLVETDMRGYFGEVSNFLRDLRQRAEGIPVEPPSRSRPQQATAPQAEVVARTGTISPAAQSTNANPVAAPGQVGAGDFLGHVPEPRSGPEDGRYDALRRGDLRALDGMGLARELQVV